MEKTLPVHPLFGPALGIDRDGNPVWNISGAAARDFSPWVPITYDPQAFGRVRRLERGVFARSRGLGERRADDVDRLGHRDLAEQRDQGVGGARRLAGGVAGPRVAFVVGPGLVDRATQLEQLLHAPDKMFGLRLQRLGD